MKPDNIRLITLLNPKMEKIVLPEPSAALQQIHRPVARWNTMLDLSIAEQDPTCSHTSLRGAVEDPRGDRRGSHLVAAGNAHVVPRQCLQPWDLVVERRRGDVDQPRPRHLPFSLTHLFDLKKRRISFHIKDS